MNRWQRFKVIRIGWCGKSGYVGCPGEDVAVGLVEHVLGVRIGLVAFQGGDVFSEPIEADLGVKVVEPVATALESLEAWVAATDARSSQD